MHRLFVWLGLLYAVVVANAGESLTPDSDELVVDSQLNEVAFIDSQTGWIVGDRGVIWHTEDGGRHWQRQFAPVRCRLESVCFLTPQDGWIAGGAVLPFGVHSRGVVLRTRDGGNQWSVVSDEMVPRILRLQMQDGRHGWAVGYRSSFFPVGVFRTEDGGRSWSTVPGYSTRNLNCGFFTQRGQGVVAGERGQIANVWDSGLQDIQVPQPNTGNIHRIHVVKNGVGWMVGDGGLVLRTTDGGLHWSVPEKLPVEVVSDLDFHAVTSVDDHVWIAGSPGSVVLYSSNGGTDWRVVHTSQSLTIRAMNFVDAQQGWAVGDLGLILRTDDGGQTWQRQGQGPSRAAMLGLFTDAQAVPLELFASLAGDEGYIGFAELLVNSDSQYADHAHLQRSADRAHDAIVAAGGSGANVCWQFPAQPRELRLPAAAITATWGRDGDGLGVEHMQECIVRKIRQWRPEVIFTESADLHGESAIGRVIHQIVLKAVDQAGDATVYTDQLTMLGLEPWKTKKVFSALPDEQTGTVSIATSTLSKRFGRSLAEQASLCRSVLTTDYQSGTNVVGFRMVKSTVPGKLGSRDFFSGISLQHGGDARRPYFRGAPVDVAVVKRAAQKRRNVKQILDQAASASSQGGAWSGQLSDLTSGLDPRSAGEVMFMLADRYAHHGQQELAADVLSSFVEAFPTHPLAEQANVWLVHYLVSGETGVRAGHVESVNVQDGPNVREAAVLARVKQMEQLRPDTYAEPSIRFPLAVAYRRSGMPREAERIFQQLASSQPNSAWGRSAVVEHWLKHARGTPAKPLNHARLVSRKPYLDGKLNEPMWQDADWLELRSSHGDDEAWPAFVALNYDSEYLYLAMNCRLAPQGTYAPTHLPRTRDAVLDEFDRIDVMIDIDRDYTSAYRFTVDHRGWTNDSCFGDPGWDPQWFVAATIDEETWNVEAAIPLSELVKEPPRPGQAWAVGAQRIVPGVGFQAWSQPANVQIVPEGFGILLFQ